MLNISNGIIARPQKVVIYGAEGVGKTTLAAAFPNPLFIDTEGGTSHMDVRRISKPQSWDEFIVVLNEVATTSGLCETLVIDTADWAEQMAVTHLLTKYKKAGIEEFGYGKGYVYLSEEFSRMLAALDKCIASGIHVVVTAHAKMRKFEQPDEMGAYDRWEMKLSKNSAPLLKEWADLLLFCNYQTFVFTTENKSQKAQGGKRVMYTSHHPCWDAKNRAGLPDVLDLDYRHIAHLFTKAAEAPVVTPVDTVRQMMEQEKISEADLVSFVASKGNYTDITSLADYPEKFITGWIIRYWKQIVSGINAINNNRN